MYVLGVMIRMTLADPQQGPPLSHTYHKTDRSGEAGAGGYGCLDNQEEN